MRRKIGGGPGEVIISSREGLGGGVGDTLFNVIKDTTDLTMHGY